MAKKLPASIPRIGGWREHGSTRTASTGPWGDKACQAMLMLTRASRARSDFVGA